MNNQARCGGGFCFHCPIQTSHVNTPALSRAQKPSPQLQNPWPLLIQSDNPEGDDLKYAHTQPLTRTLYSPYSAPPFTDIKSIQVSHLTTNRTDPNTMDIIDFNKWFIYLHEFIHLMYLDWTPAKEVARLLLSLCYNCIALLQINLPAAYYLDEEIWETFQGWTRKLEQIERNIGFVEELFATALAIKAMEAQIPSDEIYAEYQQKLKMLKEEALIGEEKNFPTNNKQNLPGFRVVYKRINFLSQIMLGNHEFASLIIPLLQPVIKVEEWEDQFPKTLDARENLNNILDAIENAARRRPDYNSTYSTNCWGNSALKKRKQENDEAWSLALTLQRLWASETIEEKGKVDIENLRGAFIKYLLDISKHSRRNTPGYPHQFRDLTSKGEIKRTFQKSYARGFPIRSGSVIILQRDFYKNQAFIAIHSYWIGDPPSQNELGSHRRLLFFEGIRQQLVARKGFLCPFNQGKPECQCDKKTKQGLQRLAHLASDGLFGPGDWSFPPCVF
jgi:hypothetical protein